MGLEVLRPLDVSSRLAPGIGIRFNVRIRAWDTRTLRGQEIEVKNLFPTGGRNQVRDLLNYPALNGDGFTWRYIAVGSNGTATGAGTTTLGTEVFRKLITRRLPLDSGFTLQLFLDPSEANGTGTQDLREVGLFTASSGGTCWARATHPLIQKNSTVAVTYDWTVTISAL